MHASHKKTLKRRQKNVFTSRFNENKCDGESLLSLSNNVCFEIARINKVIHNFFIFKIDDDEYEHVIIGPNL